MSWPFCGCSAPSRDPSETSPRVHVGTGVPGGEETVQDKDSRMTQVGRGICLTNQGAKEEGQASIQLIPVPPRMGKEAQSNAHRYCGPVQFCQQGLRSHRSRRWKAAAGKTGVHSQPELPETLLRNRARTSLVLANKPLWLLWRWPADPTH